MKNGHKRNTYLDLLRIFAAFWVLSFHWSGRGGFFPLLEKQPDLSSIPHHFDVFSSWGFLGVDLFFILSGGVIAKSAMNKSWKQFTIARFTRLFPVYFATSIIAILVIPFATNQEFQVAQLFSLSGLQFWIGGPTPLGTAWTLPFEVSFYGLVAFSIWSNSRRAVYEKRHLNLFLDIWLLIFVLSFPAKFQPLEFLVIRDFAPYFILGAICVNLSSVKDIRANAIRFSVALVLSTKVMLTRVEANPMLSNKFITTLLVIFSCIGLLIYSGRSTMGLRKSKISTSISTLALMTYPIYLLHEQIGLSVISILLVQDYAIITSYMITSFSILLVSWVSVRCIEPKLKKMMQTHLFSL
jgi:peptidoglycan/LPS O-acetylase OafA/YrhL